MDRPGSVQAGGVIPQQRSPNPLLRNQRGGNKLRLTILESLLHAPPRSLLCFPQEGLLSLCVIVVYTSVSPPDAEPLSVPFHPVPARTPAPCLAGKPASWPTECLLLRGHTFPGKTPSYTVNIKSSNYDPHPPVLPEKTQPQAHAWADSHDLATRIWREHPESEGFQ